MSVFGKIMWGAFIAVGLWAMTHPIEDHRTDGPDGCFYEGKPLGLKEALSDSLRDPASFEIIRTEHAPGSSDFRVSFRATNGFGGKSIGSLTGKVHHEGNLCRVTNVIEEQ